MSDTCPICGWGLEALVLVRHCTRPDCTYSEDGNEAIADLRRQLAQAQGVIDRLPKMIHEAFCGGWEDRDEHADVGEYFGKADMDNDWRNSEAAKTK